MRPQAPSWTGNGQPSEAGNVVATTACALMSRLKRSVNSSKRSHLRWTATEDIVDRSLYLQRVLGEGWGSSNRSLIASPKLDATEEKNVSAIIFCAVRSVFLALKPQLLRSYVKLILTNGRPFLC